MSEQFLQKFQSFQFIDAAVSKQNCRELRDLVLALSSLYFFAAAAFQEPCSSAAVRRTEQFLIFLPFWINRRNFGSIPAEYPQIPQ